MKAQVASYGINAGSCRVWGGAVSGMNWLLLVEDLQLMADHFGWQNKEVECTNAIPCGAVCIMGSCPEEPEGEGTMLV